MERIVSVLWIACPLTVDRRKGVAFLHLKPSEGPLSAPWKFGGHEDLCTNPILSSKGKRLAHSRAEKEECTGSKMQFYEQQGKHLCFPGSKDVDSMRSSSSEIFSKWVMPKETTQHGERTQLRRTV